MNKSELINDSLIELNVEAQSKEEALKKVADLVLKAGCVKSAAAYYHGMMEREKTPQPGLAAELQSLMQKWKRWCSPLSA